MDQSGQASSDSLIGRKSDRLLARIVGALTGASLSAVAAAISYWFGLYWWEMGLGPIAQIGVLVGTVIGCAAGPAAVTARRPVLFALGLAVKAVFIGLAIYLAAAMTLALATGGAIDAGAVAFLIFAVPNALVLALPVTIPIALLAVGIVRVACRRRRRGLLAVAAVAMAALGITVAVIQAAPLRPGHDPGLSFRVGQVRLEWTVVNRSSDDLVLFVGSRTEHGAGASRQGIPACFTETGSSWEEMDWFIALEHGTDADDGRIPPADVSASEVPGDEPRVWIDVAPDGTQTVILGRGAPPSEALIVDYCLEASE